MIAGSAEGANEKPSVPKCRRVSENLWTLPTL